MHIGEALLPRDEAIRIAANELEKVVARNEQYYRKLPQLRPLPERPLLDAIRADDTWYFIPFARQREDAEPLYVRVNGVTKIVVVERSF